MQLLPHKFNKFQLTEEEEVRSQLLSPETSAWIQNLLAEAAENKSNLKLDTEKVLAYAQQESFLAGQIEILQYILEVANTTANELSTGNLQT